ncbi:signal peptidase II [PVC group bacterium (ex Bugula neritina AB1)]|nr:signal peptidase II [PVC group bacterium (ex Bugula neritina AB1)]
MKTLRKNFLFWMVIWLVLFIDQLTKTLVIQSLEQKGSVSIFDPFLFFTLVKNKGAAFGMLPNQQWLFLLTFFLLLVGVWVYRKTIIHSSKIVFYGYAFIVGGAMGNFMDRLRYGAVIDFIDFRVWPVFNVADSFICVGVGMLTVCFLFYSKKAS